MGRAKLEYMETMKTLEKSYKNYCPSCSLGGVYTRINNRGVIECTCIYCAYIHDLSDRLTDVELREKRINDLL